MSRRSQWVLLAAAVLVALVIVAMPVRIVQPFAAQTAGGLALAFRLRRWAPLITALCAALALYTGWRLWSASRLLPRVLVTLAGGLVLAGAWFARQDYFEWMFAPLPDPRFVHAGEASFVAADGMVLAVSLKDDAAAYPVQQLAYHHLVEDAVGGVPIVATY